MTTLETAGRSRWAGLRPDPVLLGALAVGVLIRAPFVWQQGFPLNDGGLFYRMTQELQQARYALPAWTTYNQAAIPFAYPPLGLYLAGLLADLGRWSLVEVFRWLPLAASIANIAAFYALARALLPSRTASAGAVIAFALLPGSFAWQIMGGGVTRSLGLLFATLTVHRAYLLYTRGERRHVLLVSLFAAGTVLSHLAMAVAAAAGCALLFLVYGRNRAGVIRSLAVAGATLALTSPWWATVVLRHGVAPFLAAGGSPEPAYVGLTFLLTLQLTDEPFFPLLGGLALLGALACLARRRYLLPGWLAALFLLDPRTARTTASLPLALMAGLGVAGYLLPAVAQVEEAAPPCAPGEAQRGRRARHLTLILFTYIALYALVSAAASGQPVLAELAPEEREAMQWVAENTPPASSFLVVTGDTMWGGDRSSEWFPALAGRVSAGTVQGREWLPGFADVTYGYTSLQRCASRSVECLEDWAWQRDVAFTHIYIPKRPSVALSSRPQPCCLGLLDSLRDNEHYSLVYDGPGATVYRREAP